jgi:predicted HicB family RNase H-like nuclease
MMGDTMEYKGYHTTVQYSVEDDCLYGKILGIRDLILFEAQDVDAFRVAFHEGVDDYLAFCKEQDKPPEKEFSGRFNVRISPDAHRRLAIEAGKQGKKLNTVVAEVLEAHA